MGLLGEVGCGLASALAPDAGDRQIELFRRLVRVSGPALEPPVYAWGQPAAEQPILAGEQVDRLEDRGHLAVLAYHVTGSEACGDRDPPGVVASTSGIAGGGDEVPDHPWRQLSRANWIEESERLGIPQDPSIEVDPANRLRGLELLELSRSRLLRGQPGARLPDHPSPAAGATAPVRFRCPWRTCRYHCAIPRSPDERSRGGRSFHSPAVH